MDKLEEMDSQHEELPLIRGLLYYHVSSPNWFLKTLLKRLRGTKLKELISGASYKKALASLQKVLFLKMIFKFIFNFLVQKGYYGVEFLFGQVCRCRRMI